MVEKRRAKRYPPQLGVQAILTLGEQLSTQSSRIYDISNVGCAFESNEVTTLRPGQVGKLKLCTESSMDEVDARIERTWEKGMAVSFPAEVTTDKYCKKEIHDSGKDKKYDPKIYGLQLDYADDAFLTFAQNDYKLVHGEIIDIKSCRTNIYTGTVGLMCAAAIAICGITGAKTSAPWISWLPFATAVPLLLLSSTILSTIHKARGIQKREGYLEVLGEYILCKKKPKYYGGWIKANRVSMFCRAVSSKKTNEKMIRECGFSTNTLNCIDDSKKDAEIFNEQTTLCPEFLESFTSLSMYVYSIAYGICVSTLIVTAYVALRKMDIFEDLNTGWYIGAIVAGIMPPLEKTFRMFFNKSEHTRQRSKALSKEEHRIRLPRRFVSYVIRLGNKLWRIVAIPAGLWLLLYYVYNKPETRFLVSVH